MSTKNTFFAVESAVPLAKILEAGRAAVTDLDDTPSRVCVWVQRESDAGALRWFSFCASRRSRYHVDPLLERMEGTLPRLIVARHDDQNGVFVFERYSARPGKHSMQLDLGLLSDGDRLGIIGGEAPHPERLHADFPPRAITIGLDQFYPGEGRAYLTAFTKSEVYPVHPAEPGVPAQLPKHEVDALHGFVDFMPADWHWRRAGLPERFY